MRIQMTEPRVDNLIAFLSGDVLVMIVGWVHFDPLDFGVKVFCTVVLGIFGGAAGLFGKDLYENVKKKVLGGRKDGTV